jgi:prepilin signal peptidase PulO-like enzyme (type II secretory pathway)
MKRLFKETFLLLVFILTCWTITLYLVDADLASIMDLVLIALLIIALAAAYGAYVVINVDEY